jgi:Domain of unknown function (DUF4835)
MTHIKQLIFSILGLFAFKANAQELNCKVDIVTNARAEVSTAQKEVIEQLKLTIFDMMNSTKWTKESYQVEERINCTFSIQIKEITGIDRFSGSMQIQSTRPVYNSSYNTLLFNFLDENIDFTYARNTVLVYSPATFKDNLSSILSFYALYIIALDADSFALEGGTNYFTEAQQVVLNAQAGGAAGWKSSESAQRNRFWLVDNALQQLFKPLRVCSYNYHRKGLDNLNKNMSTSRKACYSAVLLLEDVVKTRPNSVNVSNFATCKLQELKGLYAEATEPEKEEIVQLLKKIDPANATKYEDILKN